jgi:glycosyltransferase involved in cell wall biosynthesis
MGEPQTRLLVVKAAMVRNGGAARDLMRNLSEINRRFETKFACLNILESQRKSIESLGVEVLCPAEQWKIEGGIWNEISAKQDRSSKRAWEDLDGIEQAVQWADAIHLTTGAGSMDFVSLVPDSKPLHLHFLESKPGVFDDVNHLNPDGTGIWRAKLVHLLQFYHRRRIISSFRRFKRNKSWIVNANSRFSASRLLKEYGIEGGVLYPVVDVSEFNSNPTEEEREAIGRLRTQGAPYAVTVGNMSRFKGVYEALEHVSGCDLDLVVIGGGSSEQNEKFRKKASSMGAIVQILSNLNSAEMCAIFRNARAVVGFSHGEAFGLTPVEAMAIGTPPLFVDYGGYTDTIVDGVNGRLLGRGNLEAWKQAFEQAKDERTRESWAREGRTRIQELGLTPERHADRLRKSIDSIIGV